MAVSLQVLYPVGADTTFDYDYYTSTHMGLVEQHMGPFMTSVQACKGLSGGPDTPPEFYAIFTAVFEDQEKFSEAMAAAAPVLADIPNYTNTKPQMLIGEVIG
ncbi:uncharacterized protein (TIGR02118 family) [Roseibium hamelinense]|uniref:Uncharacterized protein (TIGR02118 family) n=1 Tax=Roseibium hamelinense TaxID=150831 RepID=A0A562TBG6_9HYPH|nr:EthD family reductase [Roseibium hamelinense]MTI45496.1 EthD family reductase [Roseibium hamelinense]TWI90130.1 uncharacterized protein (TIGR02118 family) [Roseibium hamelinense]